MLEKWTAYLKALSGMKNYLAFILCLFSIAGFFVLSWFKGTDVSISVPSIVGLYIAGRGAAQVSSHWAASKDPEADTAAVIDSMNDK